MYDELKEKVLEENLMLPRLGLVTFTWGNVSEIDRRNGVFAIKPSGVEYDTMKKDDIVIIDLEGNKVDGKLRPSSDMLTHLELYRAFEEIGGIVHTHSPYATSWAQSERELPCYGTTHADTFYGSVPLARLLTEEEIEDGYEKNTGKVIVEVFEGKDVMAVPAVLCSHHGPFSWGKDGFDAVHNAKVLEECAKMALYTIILDNKAKEAPDSIKDKHYFRKHGKDAYYGQS